MPQIASQLDVCGASMVMNFDSSGGAPSNLQPPIPNTNLPSARENALPSLGRLSPMVGTSIFCAEKVIVWLTAFFVVSCQAFAEEFDGAAGFQPIVAKILPVIQRLDFFFVKHFGFQDNIKFRVVWPHNFFCDER